MTIWDSIRNWFGPAEQAVSEPATPARTPRRRKQPQPELNAKDLATQEGRPYVNIISMDFDPANPTVGSFDLEWNDIFVKQLVQSGYQGVNDEQIVDRWFQAVCRNIANEEYEQYAADPENRMISRKNLGGGRYEAS